MKFKSQICTTKEQSERLLALGLKKETADMVHQAIGTTPYKVWYKQEINDDFYPAWSLHRLLEIMYNGDVFNFIHQTTHNGNIYTIYELVIANMEELIKMDRFNRDYLTKK